MTTLEQLNREAVACTACSLAATRQRVVVASGSPSARLIIVGEAPGRSEDEGGAPFIGRSGQLLRATLAELAGLGDEDYYVTNVVKCRPPSNRTPTTREVAACRPWLEQQLPLLAGRVIAAVGLTATKALMGGSPTMAAVHGRPVSLGTRVVVPTYHPAAALRGDPDVVAAFRKDVLAVAQELAR